MLLLDISVLVLVTLAGLLDVQSGRIPNALTYSAAALGLTASLVLPSSTGPLHHLMAMALGFLPFFLLYLQGGLGGGDVKLMAAIGAIKGYPFVLNAMITSILLGGLVALLILIWEGRLLNVLRFAGATLGRIFYRKIQPEPLEARSAFPFGSVICLGTFLTIAAEWIGHSSPAEFFF